MLDLIKKTVLAGIGATVATKEVIEKRLDELVEKGKLSSQEAREVTDKIIAESRQEYENAKVEVTTFFEELLEKAHVAKKKDIIALEERIRKLEDEVE